MNHVGFARAMLNALDVKCIETKGEIPEVVEFTYPPDYMEGQELCCRLDVSVTGNATAVLYSLDKLIEETKDISFLQALEKFIEFCSSCKEEQSQLEAFSSSFSLDLVGRLN